MSRYSTSLPFTLLDFVDGRFPPYVSSSSTSSASPSSSPVFNERESISQHIRSEKEINQFAIDEQVEGIHKTQFLLANGQPIQKLTAIESIQEAIRIEGEKKQYQNNRGEICTGSCSSACICSATLSTSSSSASSSSSSSSSSASSSSCPLSSTPISQLFIYLQKNLITLEVATQITAATSYTSLLSTFSLTSSLSSSSFTSSSDYEPAYCCDSTCLSSSLLLFDFHHHIMNYIIPTLEFMIDLDGNKDYEEISVTWITPMLKLLQLVTNGVRPDIVRHIYYFVMNKVESACSSNSRLICASIIGNLIPALASSGLDEEFESADWLQYCGTLCQDTAATVRLEMTKQLAILLPFAIGNRHNTMMEKFCVELEELMRDEEKHVRAAAIETLSNVISSLPRSIRITRFLSQLRNAYSCPVSPASANNLTSPSQSTTHVGSSTIKFFTPPSTGSNNVLNHNSPTHNNTNPNSKDYAIHFALGKGFGPFLLAYHEDAMSFSNPLDSHHTPYFDFVSPNPPLSPSSATNSLSFSTPSASGPSSSSSSPLDDLISLLRTFAFYYRSLCNSTDPDLRYTTAFNFPAIVSIQRDRLKYMEVWQPIFVKLYRDEKENVRGAIAASLHIIVGMLDKIEEMATTSNNSSGSSSGSNNSSSSMAGLTPVHNRLLVKHSKDAVLSLLKDKSASVSHHVLRHLFTSLSTYSHCLESNEFHSLLSDTCKWFLSYLQTATSSTSTSALGYSTNGSPNTNSMSLSSVSSIMNASSLNGLFNTAGTTTGGQWRNHIVVYETLLQLLPLFYPHSDLASFLYDKLLPLLLTEMCSNSSPSPLKQTCISLCLSFLRFYPIQARRNELWARLIRDFALHRSSLSRCLFLDICGLCLEQFSIRWIKQNLFPLLLNPNSAPSTSSRPSSSSPSSSPSSTPPTKPFFTDTIREVRVKYLSLLPELKRFCSIPSDRTELELMSRIVSSQLELELRRKGGGGWSQERIEAIQERLNEIEVRNENVLSLSAYLFVDQERKNKVKQEQEDETIRREESGGGNDAKGGINGSSGNNNLSAFNAARKKSVSERRTSLLGPSGASLIGANGSSNGLVNSTSKSSLLDSSSSPPSPSRPAFAKNNSLKPSSRVTNSSISSTIPSGGRVTSSSLSDLPSSSSSVNGIKKGLSAYSSSTGGQAAGGVAAGGRGRSSSVTAAEAGAAAATAVSMANLPVPTTTAQRTSSGSSSINGTSANVRRTPPTTSHSNFSPSGPSPPVPSGHRGSASGIAGLMMNGGSSGSGGGVAAGRKTIANSKDRNESKDVSRRTPPPNGKTSEDMISSMIRNSNYSSDPSDPSRAASPPQSAYFAASTNATRLRNFASHTAGTSSSSSVNSYSSPSVSVVSPRRDEKLVLPKLGPTSPSGQGPQGFAGTGTTTGTGTTMGRFKGMQTAGRRM